MAVRLLGFISNPIVGDGNALFLTGTMHNIVHLATGALALAIAFILPARQQVNGVIGFGVLYLVTFVALIVSPNLFGILSYPVNLADQLLHVGLAAVSFAVAWMARSGGYTTATAGPVSRRALADPRSVPGGPFLPGLNPVDRGRVLAGGARRHRVGRSGVVRTGGWSGWPGLASPNW